MNVGKWCDWAKKRQNLSLRIVSEGDRQGADEGVGDDEMELQGTFYLNMFKNLTSWERVSKVQKTPITANDQNQDYC